MLASAPASQIPIDAVTLSDINTSACPRGFTPNIRFVNDVDNDPNDSMQKYLQREYARKRRWHAKEKLARDAERSRKSTGISQFG
jgi:hypothetical protein